MRLDTPPLPTPTDYMLAEALESLSRVEAERDAALALAERRRRDRAAVLDVKTTEGMSASEWMMRTAHAEAEAKRWRTLSRVLVAALATACDAIYGAEQDVGWGRLGDRPRLQRVWRRAYRTIGAARAALAK